MAKSIRIMGEVTYPRSSQTARFIVTYLYVYGNQTIAYLAELDNVSRQHMERTVAENIQRGWMTMVPNLRRRRSQCVHLTNEGEIAAVMFLREGGVMLEHMSRGVGIDPMPISKCPLAPGTMTRTCIDKTVVIVDSLCTAIEKGEWMHDLSEIRSEFIEEARWC
jgi:hypothetical protein